MKPLHLLTSFVALSTFSAAWPWPPSLSDLKALNPLQPPAAEYIVRRQDDGGDTGDGGGDNAASSSAAEKTDEPSRTTAKGKDSSSPDPTPPPTGSAKPSDKGRTTAKSGDDEDEDKQSSVDIDPQDRPGSVNMLKPASTDPSSYYKVSSTIKLVWNYKNVKAKPTAIDVLASVSPSVSGPVPPAFTISTNMSFHATQTLKWDTGEFVKKTSALPDGVYTLIVYDADQPKGVSATPEAGLLQPFEQFRFGVYKAQPYTSMANQYVCATCNAAMGRGERITLGFVFGMAAVTVTSFMWFAGGWGLFA